jgi:hypothetical protein
MGIPDLIELKNAQTLKNGSEDISGIYYYMSSKQERKKD